MGRRSSYGYHSYRSRSYGYGSYRHDSGGGGGKKTIIIIVTVCVILAAAAVWVCVHFGLFNGKNIQEPQTEVSEKSSDTPKNESSDAEKSEKPKQSSAESSVKASAPEKDIKGSFDGNVFVYDKQGYEIFYGTDGSAKEYAAAVSGIKKSLGDKINVYSIVAPTHGLFGLPDKYKDLGNDEKDNIKLIYSSLDKNIKTIDVAKSLEEHKDEYIYFKTDNNWTALGAYYAYKDFCKAAGVDGLDIKKLPSGEIKDFTGSLFVSTKTDDKPNGNKELSSNPDTVKYYTIPGNYTCTLLENGKNSPQEVSLIATFAEGSNAYSAFIWGNNPYMDVKTDKKTGRKLCIIKDSYGCAFAPFTVNDFDEVYIIDPTYYEGNIIDFIKKNKYTDVLILSSIMSANTEVRLDELKSVLK